MFDTELIASNPDGTSSSTIIRLRIDDENNSPPVFEPYEAHVDLQDEGVGLHNFGLPRLVGRDGDTGINCSISYTLVRGQGIFRVDRSSGQIFLKDEGTQLTWSFGKPNLYVIVLRASEIRSNLQQTAGQCSVGMFALATLTIAVNSTRPGTNSEIPNCHGWYLSSILLNFSTYMDLLISILNHESKLA